MKFLSELKESRMFRGPAGLRGHKAFELARILYVAMLALELAKKTDEKAAQLYAYKTIQFGDWEHMRFGTTDLSNLISVLGNQSDYEDKIELNLDISVPLLQTKSYMQRLRQGVDSPTLDRQFFFHLESMLHISDSTLWTIRRTVLDWNISNDSEKHMAVSNMRREINRHALLLDVAELLPKI